MTLLRKIYCVLLLNLILISCSTNPYKKSEKVYDEKLSIIQETISEKESTPLEKMEIPKNTIDSLYLKQLLIYKDSLHLLLVLYTSIHILYYF
jgi:N-acetylmuramoyl-L-alanine amidase